MNRSRSALRALTNSWSVTAVVAVLVSAPLIAMYLSRTANGPSTGPRLVRDVPPEMTVWVDQGRDMIWEHIGQGERPALPLVKLERCGEIGSALFFYGRSAEQQYLWISGPFREHGAVADGGFATSLNDPAVARGVAPCEVLVEP